MSIEKNKYDFIDEFELNKFDTSHEEQVFILETQGRNFQISKNVHDLIQTFKINKEASFKAMAIYHSQHTGKDFSEEDLVYLIEQHLVPLKDIHLTQPKAKSPLLAGVDLIPESILKPFTEALKFLFSGIFFYPIIFVSSLIQIYFLTQIELTTAVSSLQTFQSVILNGLLIGASLFFHEMGHLSACRYYGARHGAVGFGLYLYIPVFYADVTEVYKLKKNQRIVVNLGGIYFQLVLLIFLTLLNMFVFNYYISIAILFNYSAILYNLNPIFKFDGYWIVSDWLGVPNLRDRSKELFAYFYQKYIKGRKALKEPFLMKIKTNKKPWVGLYTILSIGFFSYIFFYVVPMIIWSFLSKLPQQLLELKEDLYNWYNYKEALNLAFMQQFFFNFLLFALCFYLLARLCIGVLRKYKILASTRH